MHYQIEGLTMAVTKMDEMIAFYSAVFSIEFQAREMYGRILYSTSWGRLQLLFCPADLAGNTAEQNRHQFDIVVTDLDAVIKNALANGGELMGEPTEDQNTRTASIYDPDRNSIVFKAYKT